MKPRQCWPFGSALLCQPLGPLLGTKSRWELQLLRLSPASNAWLSAFSTFSCILAPAKNVLVDLSIATQAAYFASFAAAPCLHALGFCALQALVLFVELEDAVLETDTGTLLLTLSPAYGLFDDHPARHLAGLVAPRPNSTLCMQLVEMSGEVSQP